jgi:heparan-sulfate lyase
MPDGGSFIYSGDPEGRNWFRQTKVHQTLTLNGENTAYAPKLLTWKPGNEVDMLVVENAGYPTLTHRRSIFFVDKRYFVIVDEAIGKALGEVNIHFQLAPGKAVYDTQKFTARSDFKDGWNVFVKSQDQKGLSLNEEEGQVSFIYTKKEARPAFRYSLQKSDQNQKVRFVTLVAPYKGEIPEIKVELITPSDAGSDLLQIRLTENGVEREITR